MREFSEFGGSSELGGEVNEFRRETKETHPTKEALLGKAEAHFDRATKFLERFKKGEKGTGLDETDGHEKTEDSSQLEADDAVTEEIGELGKAAEARQSEIDKETSEQLRASWDRFLGGVEKMARGADISAPRLVFMIRVADELNKMDAKAGGEHQVDLNSILPQDLQGLERDELDKRIALMSDQQSKKREQSRRERGAKRSPEGFPGADEPIQNSEPKPELANNNTENNEAKSSEVDWDNRFLDIDEGDRYQASSEYQPSSTSGENAEEERKVDAILEENGQKVEATVLSDTELPPTGGTAVLSNPPDSEQQTSADIMKQQIESANAENPKSMIWQNKDTDNPVLVVGTFDGPGPDGEIYAKVLNQDSGIISGVPIGELRAANEGEIPANFFPQKKGEVAIAASESVKKPKNNIGYNLQRPSSSGSEAKLSGLGIETSGQSNDSELHNNEPTASNQEAEFIDSEENDDPDDGQDQIESANPFVGQYSQDNRANSPYATKENSPFGRGFQEPKLDNTSKPVANDTLFGARNTEQVVHLATKENPNQQANQGYYDRMKADEWGGSDSLTAEQGNGDPTETKDPGSAERAIEIEQRINQIDQERSEIDEQINQKQELVDQSDDESVKAQLSSEISELKARSEELASEREALSQELTEIRELEKNTEIAERAISNLYHRFEAANNKPEESRSEDERAIMSNASAIEKFLKEASNNPKAMAKDIATDLSEFSKDLSLNSLSDAIGQEEMIKADKIINNINNMAESRPRDSFERFLRSAKSESSESGVQDARESVAFVFRHLAKG